MKKLNTVFSLCLSLFLTLGGLFVQPSASPVAASPGQSVIAYVLPNDTTGDEIHLINPNGTQDREIWSTGTSGLTTGPDVAELTWKPDSSELAFWSRFQEACSFYNGDIYAIRSDGTGFRRVTAPPACEANPGLPTGTVQVPVVNNTGSFATFVVYVEGAPGGKFLTLSGSGSATVTFTNVIDYGNGVPQWAVAIYGEQRFTYVKAHADVIPGKTVQTAGPLYLNYETEHWGWNSPTYNADGSQIGYFFGSGAMYDIPSNNTNPGGVGTLLLEDGVSMPLSPKRLQWGRGLHNHQLLYSAYDWDTGDSIFVANEGSFNAGDKVLELDPYSEGQTSLGLAWLPDGSGFIYSATEKDPETFDQFSNVFEFKFATQQITRITHFTTGFTRDLSISPDGQKIVFEYQASGDWSDLNPATDLWMVNRNGTGAALFVENAQSPAWSPSALPVYTYTYLPAITRK